MLHPSLPQSSWVEMHLNSRAQPKIQPKRPALCFVGLLSVVSVESLPFGIIQIDPRPKMKGKGEEASGKEKRGVQLPVFQ